MVQEAEADPNVGAWDAEGLRGSCRGWGRGVTQQGGLGHSPMYGLVPAMEEAFSAPLTTVAMLKSAMWTCPGDRASETAVSKSCRQRGHRLV